jgi:glycerate dehydrogenase
MRIVVLDGYALNPGDLSWQRLEALGKCTVHDRTVPEEVVPRLRGAGAVLINKVALPRAVLQALPELKYVGVLATGYNVVDLAAARERGVTVTNVPAYGTMSVAQMVFAHLLELTHNVGLHAGSVRRGDWTRCPDFCYWLRPVVELDGLVMGIVGFGRIGRQVAGIALAFGMKVLAYDALPTAESVPGVEMADLDRLFRESDVVTLHCPLTPETEGLVDARRLALMKPTAFLINTSRGPVVDERALAAALESGKLAGAGLDVLAVEPPPADSPLIATANCNVTPHIAWASRAARGRLLGIAVENLRAFQAGSPVNVVS